MADIFYQPKSRMFSNDGAIGSGYKFYFYQTGTTTPITTYSNVGLSVANTNPVVADSYGYFNLIYVSDFSQVKVIVKDSNDNLIYTADPVNPSGSSSITLNDLGVRPTSYWGLTSGTASAYTLAANPTLPAYSNYNTFFIQFNVACNAAPTLNVDSLGAKNLKKYTGQGTKVALQAGDVQAAQRYIGVYDGVDILILNPSSLPIQSGTASSLTIATGSVTITNDSSTYALDTEASATTDDLDTISGGRDGQIIYIRSTADARDVVVKHNTGNIYNPNGFDITLGLTTDLISLRYSSTLLKWIIQSFSTHGSSPSNLVSSQTASGSSSIVFNNLSSQFSIYEWELINILPVNNGAAIVMQLSTDNGSTWINTNYLTDGQVNISDAANVEAQSSATRINLNLYEADNSLCPSNTFNRGGTSGRINAYNLASSSVYKYGLIDNTTSRSATTGFCRVIANWRYEGATTAINAVRFIFKTFNSDVNNGNIASGTIKMRGYI